MSRELRPNPFGCQRNKGQVDVVVKGTKGFAGRGSPWQAGGEQSVSTAQAVTASTACNCLLDACAYCQALHAQRQALPAICQALPAHTKCLRIF